MKRNLLYLALLCSCLISFSYSRAQNIFSGERVMVVGSFNGYAATPYGTDYRTTTYRRLSITSGTPVDGRGQWATTINIQNSGGDAAPINMAGGNGNGFLFISGPAANRFLNKWVFSGIGQGTVDGVNTISAFNSGNDMGLNMSTAGYYSFTFNDCGYTSTNARFYVGYTQAAPVTVTRNTEVINPDGSASIGITASTTPSVQENIYVRYTLGTDFSGSGTSAIVQASGSGTAYTAVIPTQTSGTVVRYFIFTSTRSLAQLTANTEAERSIATLRYDDNSGANFVYTTTLLPVKIAAFTARANADNVLLRWTTEAEINIDRYELLRAADGITFASIYSTAARNTAGTNNYEWVDRQPLATAGFYKIAAVEKDGSRSFSQTIRIGASQSKQLVVYPNPLKDVLWVTLPFTEKGRYQLNIYNTAGQQVVAQPYLYNGTDRRLSMLLPAACTKGRYTLAITNGTANYTGDFIVQ
jgi:Secretion system C-terminal sorting domain